MGTLYFSGNLKKCGCGLKNQISPILLPYSSNRARLAQNTGVRFTQNTGVRFTQNRGVNAGVLYRGKLHLQ